AWIRSARASGVSVLSIHGVDAAAGAEGTGSATVRFPLARNSTAPTATLRITRALPTDPAGEGILVDSCIAFVDLAQGWGGPCGRHSPGTKRSVRALAEERGMDDIGTQEFGHTLEGFFHLTRTG